MSGWSWFWISLGVVWLAFFIQKENERTNERLRNMENELRLLKAEITLMSEWLRHR